MSLARQEALTPTPLGFYTFSQNNSGGSFYIDPEAGIGHYTIVQAASADEANDRAERIGLYFNGSMDGRDCDCCGDRFYAQYRDEDADPVPSIYGEPVTDRDLSQYEPVFVHYLDGRIEAL